MATLPEVTARLDADVSGFISAWERAAEAATRAAARIRAAQQGLGDLDINTGAFRDLDAEMARLATTVRQASDTIREFGNSTREAGGGIDEFGRRTREAGGGIDDLGRRAGEAASALGGAGGGGGLGGAATKSGAATKVMAAAILVAASLLPAVAAAALASGAALGGLAMAAGVVALGWKGIEQAGERLKASLGGLQKQLESVFRSGLSQEFTELGQAISSLDGPLKRIAQSVVGLVKEFTGWIRSSQGMKEIETGLGGVDNLIKSLGPGVKALAQIFTGFGAAAAPVMDEIGQAISSVFENLKKVIDKGKETGQLEKAFQNGAKAIEAFGEVLAGIVDILIEVAGSAGEPAADAIKKFGQAMQDAAPLIGTLFNFLSSMINVISTVVGWFAKLAKELEPLYRVFNQAGDAFNNFIKAISPGSKELEKFGAVVAAVFGDKLKDTVKRGVDGAVQAVKEWWTKTVQDVKSGTDKVIQSVKEWWTKTTQEVKSGVAKIVQEVKQWWTKTTQDVKSGVDKVVQEVKQWWTKTVQEAKTGTQKVIQAVKEWWQKTQQDVKAGIDKIVEDVKQWWVDMVETVKEGVDKVVEALKELPQKALDALNPFKDDMKQVGKDSMDGMAEGIKSAVGNLVAAATQAAKQALQAIKSTLGIASPSKVFANEVGAMIPAGIAQGLIGSAHLVTDAMRRAGLADAKAIMGGTSLGGVNIARNSSSQQTFNLRITGGSDTAVGTMIQRLAQQGKLKITANAVVGKR